MVTEHHGREYPSHLLADTFRMATWGIGLATIASGFAAEASVKGMNILAPFNVAIGALESIALDGRLLMMGLVQALFEGSMMTWIVLWVPAIQNAPESKVIALGTVFSTLMMSMCGGSSLFKLLTEGLPEGLALSPEACLVAATGLATAALATSSTGVTAEKVPMNLVAALMMVGPVGNRSRSIEERIDSVFGILAGLTGVATLIQLGGGTAPWAPLPPHATGDAPAPGYFPAGSPVTSIGKQSSRSAQVSGGTARPDHHLLCTLRETLLAAPVAQKNLSSRAEEVVARALSC
eukprot:jgi/Undpi1/3024/HiC_scaffold_14.g06401.m1